MKRIDLSTLVVPFAVMLAVLPISLQAQFGYTIIHGSVTITNYTGVERVVQIPATLAGLPVTGIKDAPFFKCANVKSVILPQSLTNLGYGAFSGCASLTNVTIPKGIKRIGTSAFQRCTGLIRMEIPDGVTNLGDDSFDRCSAMTSVSIPNTVTNIGNGAFAGCSNLTTVTIPSSVVTIGDYAFSGCSMLQRLYFAGNLPQVNGPAMERTPTTVFYLPGATGWGSNFEGRPAKLWNPQVATNTGPFGLRDGQFGITITGTDGIPFKVEASDDLGASVWTSISTNALTGGSAYFSDPDSASHPIRIYRFTSY